MLNNNALAEIISSYKEEFKRIHEEENYKWKAVKCFQDNWNENAVDFPLMLDKALGKAGNLLVSRNFYPKGMICGMAKKEPEAVRVMFIALFDELQPVTERIEKFIEYADELRKKYGGAWNNHYQTFNSVSVYLFFRYPNKYYIYKYRKFKELASKIEYPVKLKMGNIEDIQNYFNMCNEILEIVKQDNELLNMSKNRLTEEDFPDNAFHVLTDDIVFYGRKNKENLDSWWPTEEEYHPGIDKDKWLELLSDTSIFTYNSKVIMKRMLHIGGEATCTQLSQEYGETKNFYNIGSSSLAKRICQATGCPYMIRNNENSRWWPILYIGKYAEKDVPGVYIWRLRPELIDALKGYDLSDILLYSNAKNDSTEIDIKCKAYAKQDFLSEVYLSEGQYDSLVSLLEHKKNIILQGAPGVGKTFTAKRLAYSILGKEDDNKVKIVQFHQNYYYEDFIMGYKPDGTGFKLQTGIFYEFCQQAENNPDDKYFFIIDEINRGNLSKIFGELLMTIEKDYRGNRITMAYNGLQFSVPENVYIIGMMNMADRSLAIIDYALRRRFSFFDMIPAFENDTFKSYQKSLNNDMLDDLIRLINELNLDIEKDASLGKGFCIGHSYFCGQEFCTDELLSEIVEYDFIPMLNEYWFDNKDKAQNWAKKLRGVLHD